MAQPATAGGTVWDRVAACESGGNWSINTGNGYYGGLQFSYQTWKGFGGQRYAATANRATKSQQIAIAQNVLKVQGPGAWPVCSVRAGLTRTNGAAVGGATSDRARGCRGLAQRSSHRQARRRWPEGSQDPRRHRALGRRVGELLDRPRRHAPARAQGRWVGRRAPQPGRREEAPAHRRLRAGRVLGSQDHGRAPAPPQQGLTLSGRDGVDAAGAASAPSSFLESCGTTVRALSRHAGIQRLRDGWC